MRVIRDTRKLPAMELKRLIPLWVFVGLVLTSCERRVQEHRPPGPPPGSDIELSMAQGYLADLKINSENAQRGALVVAGGATCKAFMTCFSCFQCHGLRGEGGAGGLIPRLAGQNADYLHSALQRFASGERSNSTMHDVASALTEGQMVDVAAYYSSMTPIAVPALSNTGNQRQPDNDDGQRIAQQGISAHGVPACTTCHAIARNAGSVYPYLSGQFSDYLAQQLENFRNGSRRGGQAVVMQTIARGLTEEQGRAVSEYYSRLAPAAAPGLPEKENGRLSLGIRSAYAANTFDLKGSPNRKMGYFH